MEDRQHRLTTPSYAGFPESVYVLEVRLPGDLDKSFIDDVDRDTRFYRKWDTERLIDLLTWSVHDLAVSLTLFEAARDDRLAQRPLEETIHRNRTEVSRWVDILSDGIADDLEGPAKDRAYDEAYAEAMAIAKRKSWHKGELPADYLTRSMLLHAKSFVYALDAIEKSLKHLSMQNPGKYLLWFARQEFRRAFPHVEGVRNSAHHIEDRIQMKTRRKRIESREFLIDALTRESYGGTMEDGEFGNVHVTLESAALARDIVHVALGAFDWKGISVIRP